MNTVAHSKSLLCSAVSLRDDFRAYLPELLPRFIGLFAEAERSGNYDQVLCLHNPLLVHPLYLLTVLSWLLIGLAWLGRCTFSFLSILCAFPLFCYGFSLALHCLVAAHSPSSPSSVHPYCFVTASVWSCIAWSPHCLPASGSLSLKSEMMYLYWHGADVMVCSFSSAVTSACCCAC